MPPKYHLEKYRSRDNRYTCPQCGKPNCFTRYVDENGFSLADHVGKCDRIAKCGYHYTPRDFYNDNPWDKPAKDFKPKPIIKEPEPEPVYLPEEYVSKSMTNGPDAFLSWLSGITSPASAAEAIRYYRIGTTAIGKYRNKGVIFWQIDRTGLVRDGKIMWYRPDGHREKMMTWISSSLRKSGLYPEQQTRKCLFGEHLLEDPVLTDLPVCIVESEKSAIVCSILFPDFLWLATCGCGGLNRDKLRPLSRRSIAVFPDSGSREKWCDILISSGQRSIVYDGIEGYPPNTDLVDILIDHVQPEPGNPTADIREYLEYFKTQI